MFTRVSVESKLELTRVRWRVVVVLLRRERVIRFGGWCAQTIRERFFIDHSKRKDISMRAEKEHERRKLFMRERERERGFGESSNKKLFCCDWLGWFQNFLFCFPFFPLLLLFQQAVVTGKKNEKFGLNSASKRPHWKRDNYTRISATMAKRTKSARKAAKSVRPNRELLAREDETRSHLLLPFFFARLSVFIYIYIWYINLDSPNSKGFPSPNSLVPEGINL